MILASLPLWFVLLGFSGTGSVRGTVVDAGTLQAVPYAQVWIESTKRGELTDATGAFRLDAIPSGFQRLHVTAMGYPSRTILILISSGRCASVEVRIRGQFIRPEKEGVLASDR